MTTRALLLGTVLAFACAAAAPAAEPAKRQSGQIVYDNVPETPAALKAAIITVVLHYTTTGPLA